VRLLLDAPVSGASVGGPLRADGHDARSLDADPAAEALDDEEVLALATAEHRILLTHDVADFPTILREWAEADRSHAGVIVVYGIDHSEFGLMLRGVRHWLERRPQQEDWLDFAAVVDRGTGT
jgi:hypothetical protein